MAHWERPIHKTAYNYVITFGPKKGMTYGDVRERSAGYLEWLSGSFAMPEKVRVAAAKTLMGESLDGLNLPTSLTKPKVISISGKVEMWANPRTKNIGVRFPKDDNLRDRFFHTINGAKWNDEDGHYEFPPQQIILAVDQVFGGKDRIEATESVKAFYTSEVKRRKLLDHIREREDVDIEIPGVLLPPYPYQKVTIAFGLATGGRFLIGHQMGLGKTPIAMYYALYKKLKTVIVCPKKAKNTVWKKLIPRFTGQQPCLWDAKGHSGNLNAQFHVVHFDVVARYVKEFNKMGFQLLVVDEAHKLGNYKSIRTKAVLGNWKERGTYPGIKTKEAMFLSGTPLRNANARSIFPILHYIDKKRFANPKAFIERYEDEETGLIKNAEELNRLLNDVMIRFSGEQVKLERPPIFREDLEVELEDAEIAAYLKFEKEMFKRWGKVGRPSAAQAPEIRNFLFNYKFPRVVEFVQELLDSDRNVLVFTIQQEHAERIAAHFGNIARYAHGKMPQKAYDKAIDDLSTGKARVGAITLNTGAEAIDGLQESMDAVVFIDMWWLYYLHDQAEKRLHRPGQKSTVNSWYVKCVGTMEEQMWEVVEEKMKAIDRATDGKVVTQEREKSIFKEVIERLALARGQPIEGLEDAVEIE
jgi:hypothetical protein